MVPSICARNALISIVIDKPWYSAGSIRRRWILLKLTLLNKSESFKNFNSAEEQILIFIRVKNVSTRTSALGPKGGLDRHHPGRRRVRRRSRLGSRHQDVHGHPSHQQGHRQAHPHFVPHHGLQVSTQDLTSSIVLTSKVGTTKKVL